MRKTKLGKSSNVVHFRNILPTTHVSKSEGYYKYGWNDNLPLEIIEAINNSGVAKKACRKYAEFIEADGFIDLNLSKVKVNQFETMDKLLSKVALSFGYMDCAVFHISRLGNGLIGSVKLLPFQKVRKGINNTWFYNETVGAEKYDKKAWVELQNFQGEIASFEAMSTNLNQFEGRGEIYYIYDGNPFDSDVYAIPDFVASIEDLKTSSELSKMDYEAVLNGFVLGGVATFIGVDGVTQDSYGQTDQDKIIDGMMQFTGLRKNKDGLTSRFALLTNFVETKDQVPIFTNNDPKPILEASNTKRDIIERAVCRLWGVNPALIGYSDTAILGNTDAINQAKQALIDAVNPTQRLISEAFRNMFGNKFANYDISEFKVNAVNTTPNA